MEPDKNKVKVTLTKTTEYEATFFTPVGWKSATIWTLAETLTSADLHELANAESDSVIKTSEETKMVSWRYANDE